VYEVAGVCDLNIKPSGQEMMHNRIPSSSHLGRLCICITVTISDRLRRYQRVNAVVYYMLARWKKIIWHKDFTSAKYFAVSLSEESHHLVYNIASSAKPHPNDPPINWLSYFLV
jgi:hypothetical protein